MSKNTLFVIDAYNLIYRMFYAIPEMTTRSGDHVNAIFGVAKFLRSLALDNPTAHMVVTTDVGQSFRAELYAEYKGTRDRMPDSLRSQIDGVFALFDAAGIQTLSRPGYEADDIIGSIASQHESNDYQVVIISSDKDLCQFVHDGHVHIYDAMKRKFMRESDVVEKFGVPASQVRDYLAIVGDSSDNIPGITGWGPKKAVDLLSKYHTLDGIYDHIDELTPKMQEALRVQRENAYLSQKLATIVTDLEIESLPREPFAPGIESDVYLTLLRQYEFKSLLPIGGQGIETPVAHIEFTEIVTLEALSHIISDIRGSVDPVILSTEMSGVITLGLRDQIYQIDPKNVDTTDLISCLFDPATHIVGYDLKVDIKRLYDIQKPAEVAGEGQGRLF